MVCMALPPHLWYRVENMYLVGIMPGPNKPSLDQINGYFTPLVDVLLQLWSTGMIFEQVALHPAGCRVRAAVIALVCDLMGMRKVLGFASHTADMFCAYCGVLKQNMANFDPEEWGARNRESHMEHALRYKRAKNKRTREVEFAEGGIRWSEFLRLPYCVPEEFGVVDSMHNMLLGNLRHHCRDVWGMDSGATPHKGMTPHDTAKQKLVLDDLAEAIRKGQKGDIEKPRKSYILAFVRWNHVHVGAQNPFKADLVDALITWVSERPIGCCGFR
jgi:hypothetical protein